MATAKGKGKEINLTLLSLLLALLFLLAGGSKLFAPELHFNDFQSWGYLLWSIWVIGMVEVGGALLLVLPQMRFFGAVLLAANMLGATVTHLRSGQMNRFPVPVVLCGTCLLIAYRVRAREES